MFDPNRSQARRNLDKRLNLLRDQMAWLGARSSWIHSIRYALGLTGTQLASRMGVTRQRISMLEQAEREGSVTLASLQKAANAMECTFVYAFVPYETLEDMVQHRAHAIAKAAISRAVQSMKLEDQEPSTSEVNHLIDQYVLENISETDLWMET